MKQLLRSVKDFAFDREKSASVLFGVLVAAFVIMGAFVKPPTPTQSNAVMTVITAICIGVLLRVYFTPAMRGAGLVRWFILFIILDFITSETGAIGRTYFYATNNVMFYLNEFQPRLSIFRLAVIAELMIVCLLIGKDRLAKHVVVYFNIGLGCMFVLYGLLQLFAHH